MKPRRPTRGRPVSAAFDLDELFELALQMEAAGEAFYKEAALLFENPAHRRLLSGLAQAEDRHGEILREMHLRQKDSPAGVADLRRTDPSGSPSVAFLTMEALVANRIFGLSTDPGELFSGEEDLETILHRALEKEKEAVLFYQTLQDLTEDPAHRDVIVEILMEEIKHASTIRSELARLHQALSRS